MRPSGGSSRQRNGSKDGEAGAARRRSAFSEGCPGRFAWHAIETCHELSNRPVRRRAGAALATQPQEAAPSAEGTISKG